MVDGNRRLRTVVLGDVLAAADDRRGAATSYGKALSLFERKGFTVMAERARERRDALLLQLEQ